MEQHGPSRYSLPNPMFGDVGCAETQDQCVGQIGSSLCRRRLTAPLAVRRDCQLPVEGFRHALGNRGLKSCSNTELEVDLEVFFLKYLKQNLFSSIHPYIIRNSIVWLVSVKSIDQI